MKFILLFFLVYGASASHLLGTETDVNDQKILDKNWISIAILAPIYRTRISTEVNAPVKKIYKRSGDSFKKGELIMQLDSTILRAQYDAAKAKMDKTTADLEAKRELYQDSLIPLHELRQAVADAEEAKALLAISRYKLDSASIKGPFDGKVVNLLVEEHEYIEPPKELVEVIDDHILLIKVLMPSSRLRQLKIGRPISIKINEIDRIKKAKISRIGAVIDPASSTIEIEAELDNASGILKSGMTGEVLWNDQPSLMPERDQDGLNHKEENNG